MKRQRDEGEEDSIMKVENNYGYDGQNLRMIIFYDTYHQFNDEDWFPGMPYPGRWL